MAMLNFGELKSTKTAKIELKKNGKEYEIIYTNDEALKVSQLYINIIGSLDKISKIDESYSKQESETEEESTNRIVSRFGEASKMFSECDNILDESHSLIEKIIGKENLKEIVEIEEITMTQGTTSLFLNAILLAINEARRKEVDNLKK